MSLKAKSILNRLAFAITPLVLVWYIDWYTKNWALKLQSPQKLGFLDLGLVYNHGVMLGISSHLPLLVKIAGLTTLGAIILCSYALVVAIMPMRSIFLRLGLPILVGGIIGNVSDRFINSAVIDFISFRLNNFNSPVMNVADICQWFGYSFILLGLYQDSHYYWPTQDWRNKFFINPHFQVRTGLILGAMSFTAGIVTLIFGLSFFQHNLAQDNVGFYLKYGAVLTLFLSFASFFLGVVLSHRVAGPLYALKRYLNDSYEGKKIVFKLRENDEFKVELEAPLTALNAELQRLYEIEKIFIEQETPPPLPHDVFSSEVGNKVA